MEMDAIVSLVRKSSGDFQQSLAFDARQFPKFRKLKNDHDHDTSIPTLHFVILTVFEKNIHADDAQALILDLLKVLSPKQLSTCKWGSTNITALELARLTDQKSTISILEAYATEATHSKVDKATPVDQFQRLRQFAENAGQARQAKRLTIADKRQLEMASIAKQSRVKNNPLFKEIEEAQSLTKVVNYQQKSSKDLLDGREVVRPADTSNSAGVVAGGALFKKSKALGPRTLSKPLSEDSMMFRKSLISVTSDTDSEQWFDTFEDYGSSDVQRYTRLSRQISPLASAEEFIPTAQSPYSKDPSIDLEESSENSELTITTTDTVITRHPSCASDESIDGLACYDTEILVEPQVQGFSPPTGDTYHPIIKATPQDYIVRQLSYKNFQGKDDSSLAGWTKDSNFTESDAFLCGKLYLRITETQDILLPLPSKATFARCIISDGQNDFVTDYIPFENNIPFQYECIMDSSPNTIISIGLQVKPDIHVKPLTGFSRLFTSIQKQKEHLSGYVHPSDYLLGQSRFALQHMMDACNQKVYNGCFDLFNSWYVKSAREKRRALDSDIVKIIGNIKVDLLYLPMSRSSTQTQIPRTLKECDLALKIRQWHNTMWVCGYISVRQAEKTVWSRSFYQLVGSRLLEFSSHRDTGNLVNFYDIGDVAKLIVAAEQTLVDVRGETFTQIFTQDTICDDNSKGFFRIAFTNGSYIDCICDRVEDSELWVSMLKTMVGKVPVRKPF